MGDPVVVVAAAKAAGPAVVEVLVHQTAARPLRAYADAVDDGPAVLEDAANGAVPARTPP